MRFPPDPGVIQFIRVNLGRIISLTDKHRAKWHFIREWIYNWYRIDFRPDPTRRYFESESGRGGGGRDRNEHPINPAKIFVLLMIFRVIKHFPPPPFWKIFPVIPVPVSLVPFDNLGSHEYIYVHIRFLNGSWRLDFTNNSPFRGVPFFFSSLPNKK